MEWKDAKKHLLKNNKIKQSYMKVDLGYEIGVMVSEARLAKSMTQTRLAEILGTKQPAIARLERGSYLPSLPFLQRVAKAFNTQLLPPRFEMLETKNNTSLNVRLIHAYKGSYTLSSRPEPSEDMYEWSQKYTSIQGENYASVV